MTTSISVNPTPEGWKAGAFLPVKTVSAVYTATDLDRVIVGTAAITITLPTAVGIAGRVYVIKNGCATDIDVTVDADGTEAVDGGTGYVLDQYESITLISNGTKWWTIGKAGDGSA